MTKISRRNLLKGAGGAMLALPRLDSIANTKKDTELPKRFVGMYHTNGVNPYKLLPTTAGRNYELPENVALLKDYKDQLTMLSGLAHWRSPHELDIVVYQIF